MPTKELHSSTLWWATNNIFINMKNNNYKKWTNEEDLVIISMRKEGKTAKDIAVALGRTTNTIYVRLSKLINECKIEKKVGGLPSKLNFEKIATYVSESPNNLRNAFKKYAKEIDVSWTTVASAYYSKGYIKNQIRVKDKGVLFTVIGKNGHTTHNSKNCETIKRSNLWSRMKEWLLSSLLS